jgi:excisionase family DNA binding protein
MESIATQQQKSAEGELLNIEELSKLLNLPKSWIYERTRRGEIPHRKLGKYLRFDIQEIKIWLEQHQRGI